jgi:methyltransferase (TIGR00027 family)
MDTFAFRRPDLRAEVTVFEIDHPATQAFKRTRLAEIGLATPPNLSFIPADLERETVDEALMHARFDPTIPTVFAWLGVVMYLTREAIADPALASRRGGGGQ